MPFCSELRGSVGLLTGFEVEIPFSAVFVSVVNDLCVCFISGNLSVSTFCASVCGLGASVF